MKGVGSRNKLTPWHAQHYQGETLLDHLGRTLCGVGCLPRKELHEAWEMATRIHEVFRGGRVVDLACGYGLLGQFLILLDDDIVESVGVDIKLPGNQPRLHQALAVAFPVLGERVRFLEVPLQDFPLTADDIVVSSHACGGLTDAVLQRAVDAGARVAVLPCCHRTRIRADLADLDDPVAAMDAERVECLKAQGYQAWATSIPETVSQKNRLLLGQTTTSMPSLL